jgi:hypothetical protein
MGAGIVEPTAAFQDCPILVGNGRAAAGFLSFSSRNHPGEKNNEKY